MPTSTVENTATIRRSFLPMVSLLSISTCGAFVNDLLSSSDSLCDPRCETVK